MRLFVTGGNGFIGRYVVAEALRRGHQLSMMVRPGSKLVPPDGVEVITHDLRFPLSPAATLAGIQAVIHCAAATHGDFETQFAGTVTGTQNLLNSMKEGGVGTLVGISTLAVYDFLNLPQGSVLDEESPLDSEFANRGPYIHAKRLQEDLMRDAALPRFTLLRPGIVFGKDRTWFYHLGRQLSPRTWLCLAGESRLPLTYVENCAAAVLDAVDNDNAHRQILNIVDDDVPTHKQYTTALAKYVTPPPGIITVPWTLLDTAALAVTWISRGHVPDLLDRAAISLRCKPLSYDNRRAKKMGWKPRWSWAEGLARSFQDEL